MNPILGVFFHWVGGLASASFYVPYRRVRNWSWETYWLVGGFFSWILVPWLLAATMTENLREVLGSQSWTTLGWTYLFGVLWGLGGLTFGLTMRFLGLSLGMGMALGYTAAFGTLVPPLAKSLIPHLPIDDPPLETIAATTAGQVTLLGIGICLLGIAVTAFAGLAKERELPEVQKREAIKEFNFLKGAAVATFSGVMSACFAFALAAAKPIAVASAAAGTNPYWIGLPKLVVVLLGGFSSNFVWCALLNVRNRSAYEYFGSELRTSVHGRRDETILESTIDAPSEEAFQQPTGNLQPTDRRIPRLNNYFFSALAGTLWYLQFFFYTMGETQMKRFGFASWTLHMASIIIFSTLWGVYFHEWRGASRKARGLMTTGIALLILSTIVIGLGTYLKSANA
ncbi:MAG: L-rhamnose/proton symporter RhaT [Pirellulales bacterium]|nr:L-rhamnose/proton symporter RhaT [Pirellulales bacterium]